MNNNFLNLNALTALEEGPYQDCTLVRIDVIRDGSEGLKYLELIFKIKGHDVVDRIFGKNSPRLQMLIKSLMPYVPEGQLNLSAWRDVRCNLKLKNYVSGGIEYPQTFDWDWINPSNKIVTTPTPVTTDKVALTAGEKFLKKMLSSNHEGSDFIGDINTDELK